MINGNYFPGHSNIVFSRFPEDPVNFTYDVRQILEPALQKYGEEEWKACVMTDEFHGHLGVYSIVGAKMGIKAREIFGVGPDQLEVVSFAGTRPPYSCLNDGIQVSTGATLGQGTISVAGDSLTSPSAIFIFKNRSVKLTLKPEYHQQVDEDIREGIVKFGLLDDGYWKLVRRNALKYWLNWDRDSVFNIEEVNLPINH
jgi:pyrimidine-specific ribonucleoside hydrolase